MIGTFYRQAGPDKPIFVNVGDEVNPGKPRNVNRYATPRAVKKQKNLAY